MNFDRNILITAAAQILAAKLLGGEKTGAVVEVPLSQGQVALIDAEDAERVLRYKWSLHKTKKNKRHGFYARRNSYESERTTTIYLHRFITKAPQNLQVDHINHDTLDNRKSNLRFANNQQNQCNRKHVGTKTGFRGVAVSSPNRFYVRITFNSKKIVVGSFKNAELAARAYDEKAKELFGEFATLNFPSEVSK